MSHSTKAVIEKYYSSWKDGEETILREALAPDVTFRGPLAKFNGADEFIEGLKWS